MTTIAAVHGALPPNRYPQEEITAEFARVVLGDDADPAIARRVHANARVDARHLTLPLDRYRHLDGFDEANAAWIETAEKLAVEAISGALDEAGLNGSDVDVLFSTTVTGIAVPSLDARIAGRLGLRDDVRRVPLFGLGCVAGAAGLARAHDYLLGHPDQIAVLLSVELCSLTIQRDDRSMANLVACGLFGDGASAAVLAGAGCDPRRVGPEILDSRSRLYPDSLRTMGWDVGSSGLRIVLDAEVPTLVGRYMRDDLDGFLGSHDLTVSDVATWVSHPGGPKVIEAIVDTLDLGPHALELTWRSLAEVGNLSSSSVLFVLRDTIAKTPPGTGDPALLMAMGPGFCAEYVLLRW